MKTCKELESDIAAIEAIESRLQSAITPAEFLSAVGLWLERCNDKVRAHIDAVLSFDSTLEEIAMRIRDVAFSVLDEQKQQTVIELQAKREAVRKMRTALGQFEQRTFGLTEIEALISDLLPYIDGDNPLDVYRNCVKRPHNGGERRGQDYIRLILERAVAENTRNTSPSTLAGMIS